MMACKRSGACLAILLGVAVLSKTVEVEGAKPAISICTDDCLLTANLARTARLNTRVGLLVKDAQQETAAQNAIDTNSLGGADTGCTVPDVKPATNTVSGLMAKIPQGTQFNCPSVINGVVSAGVTALATFPNQPWDNGTSPPYNGENVQNLMYLLYAQSTAMGCARTTDCTAGNYVLLCRFNPTLTEAYHQPILTEDLYNALRERQAKGIDLSKLTSADLNTDLEGKQPSAAAILAIPGVIPATALTLTSLLGFASSIH